MYRICFLLPRISALIGIAAGLAASACAADYAKQAREAVAAPFKVAVSQIGQGQKAGQPIDVNLQLQNGKSQPSPASKYTPIQVQVIGKSGEVVETKKCGIQAKSADGKCTLQAPAAGIYKLKALPDDHELLDGSGFLLVLPKDNGKTPPEVKQNSKPPVKPQVRLHEGSQPAWLSRYGVFLFNAADQTAAPPAVPSSAPASTCQMPLSHSAAKVALLINEGSEDGGAFRAVVESATITAFFQADDGGAAPRDIRIWLSPDHGSLNPPFLLIAACSYTAETQLSSSYPVVASVKYNVVPNSYPVDPPANLTARFLRPIVTVNFEPNGPQTLSLIDRGPFVTVFIDVNGNVVSTDLQRDLKFVSNSSIAGPQLETVTVKSGDYSADNVVLPFSPGKATISVTADRLQTAVHDVQVVGAAVYLYCLIGGVLGGLISSLSAGGFKASRIVTGVVCGIVLAWAYVFRSGSEGG